jgi:hypothetical protein
MTKKMLKIDELAVLAKMLRGKRPLISQLSGMSEETVDNFFIGRSKNVKVLEVVNEMVEQMKTEPNCAEVENLKRNIAEFTA